MIEIKGLDKRYIAGEETTVALDRVTMTLPNKGLVLITGKNGSGKSTLLNMIGLIDSPDEGSIRFNGDDITGLKGKAADTYRRKEVSYIFQTTNLVATLSAQENLTVAGMTEQEAANALRVVGLEEHADKLPPQLSQGQLQKIAVQRAMLAKSSLILADEPTSALDTQSKADVAKLLTIASRDKLVLIVTHDLSLFKEYDLLITFCDGRADIKAYEESGESIEEIISPNGNQNAHLQKDGKEAKSFGGKVLLKSALRGGKKKIFSTIVISILLVMAFSFFNMLLSVPIDEGNMYESFADYYVKNNFNYVIVGGDVDGYPRNSVLSASQFSRDIIGTTARADDTPIYYLGGLDLASVVQSGAMGDNIQGAKPQGKGEIAITDYYADLLIYFYGYTNYDDILSRGYLSLSFDGAPFREIKIVGIVKTIKDDFADMKDVAYKDIKDVAFYFENFASESLNNVDFTSKTQERAMLFKTYCEYMLAKVYMQEGFDEGIENEITHVNTRLSISEYAVAKLSAYDEIDTQRDIYKTKDVDGVYVLLSDVVSASELYKVIKDCTNEQERRSAIQEYVEKIELDSISLSYDNDKAQREATVVGYIDDIGKSRLDAVYATDGFAISYFADCIEAYAEKNPRMSYVAIDNKGELMELFYNPNAKVYFPSTNAFADMSAMQTITFLASLIGAIISLVFVLAMLFNDCAYYFRGNKRDFALLKAMGAPMRKIAFVAMFRYVIAMCVDLVLSAVIAPIILSVLNDMSVVPYSLVWLSFNPLALLCAVILAVLIVAIAFAFQYRMLRKKSLGQLIKDTQ